MTGRPGKRNGLDYDKKDLEPPSIIDLVSRYEMVRKLFVFLFLFLVRQQYEFSTPGFFAPECNRNK